MRRVLVCVVAVGLLAAGGALGPAIGQDDALNRGVVRQEGDVGTADAGFAFHPDLVFVPIEPCRVVDTRGGGGGRLGVNAVRSYRILDELGATSFASQGGIGQECNTSPFASAVAVNITAVDPAAKGFVRAWPYDEPTPPVPNATVLNYSSALNASNGVDIKVCDEFVGGTCTRDLFVKNFGSTTHLIIDVLGFFTQQTYAAVDGATGDLVAGNAGILGSERTGVGEYRISFAQIVPLCGWVGALEGGTTGQITTELDTAPEPNPTFVLAHISDSAGIPADRSFQVFLRC